MRKMQHSSPDRPASETQDRSPTRRSLAKQQTRQRILVAARRLFGEAGYDGATIRDIATAAGMSTGAVFANFTDKSDLFIQIMAEDGRTTLEAMQAAADQGADIEAALVGALMAGYGLYRRQAQLAHTALSVAWTQGGIALRGLDFGGAVRSLFEAQVSAAEARGELRADPSVSLRSEMLYDVYLANFQLAITEAADFAALEARVRGQVRILLAGVRRIAA